MRLADARDLPLLRAMLYEAFSWRPDAPRLPFDEALARPEIARYVDGWGRHGDLGVIADEDVGAAWVRLFTDEDHGYGFVAPDVPELSIGASQEVRGRGVGTALLSRPALHLYERFGFERVGYVGTSWTMQRILD